MLGEVEEFLQAVGAVAHAAPYVDLQHRREDEGHQEGQARDAEAVEEHAEDAAADGDDQAVEAVGGHVSADESQHDDRAVEIVIGDLEKGGEGLHADGLI